PSTQAITDEVIEAKPVISTIPTADDTPLDVALKAIEEAEERGDYVPEFSEEEITAAFRFIDLDHNNFVGAAEIRHILVCMGEMITDEEIDMMINMVDVDGDGQVRIWILFVSHVIVANTFTHICYPPCE
ncbi:hypothetical protein EON65_40685, partial [archaeon]